MKASLPLLSITLIFFCLFAGRTGRAEYPSPMADALAGSSSAMSSSDDSATAAFSAPKYYHDVAVKMLSFYGSPMANVWMDVSDGVTGGWKVRVRTDRHGVARARYESDDRDAFGIVASASKFPLDASYWCPVQLPPPNVGMVIFVQHIPRGTKPPRIYYGCNYFHP